MDKTTFDIFKERLLAQALLDHHLSNSAFRVLEVYLSYMNLRSGLCLAPSNKYLAIALDVHPRSIGRAIKQLKALGYISKRADGYGFDFPALKRKEVDRQKEGWDASRINNFR